jgi:hypothetical protein
MNYKLRWLDNNKVCREYDLGRVLEEYGFIFIGRFTGSDALEARKHGVIEKSSYSLYIFRPGEVYHYMELEDGYVSRRHALIESRRDGIFITDHGPEGRGSKNGTFINGKKIEPGKPYRLNRGDEISLGSETKLKIE